MYASLKIPKHLTKIELDLYLKKGWFRIGNEIFTTNFLNFKDQLYNAIWLRVNLEKHVFSNSQLGILKRGSRFTVSIHPFILTEEKRDLYLKYRNASDFNSSQLLENSIQDSNHLFDSYDVCIYDHGRLIACGVFDIGDKAAAGILSFYDPEYKKYSLGKLLVLHKLNYCKSRSIMWFYPGYIVPGYKRFDYKLQIGNNATEYFEITHSVWKPINSLNVDLQTLNRMHHALKYLEANLRTVGIEEIKFQKYRYFDIMIDTAYSDYDLLQYPYFIQMLSHSPMEELIIIFDTIKSRYQLVVCHKVFKVTQGFEDTFYSNFLLRKASVILEEKHFHPFLFGLIDLISEAAER